MNFYERVRVDCCKRIRQFGLDNAADFLAGSVAAIQFAVISEVVDTVEQLTARFSAKFGDARFGFLSKATARENLRDLVSEISAIARSMAYEFPGIELKFRIVRNLSDANLLALAKAFYQESEAYKPNFISYELDKNFREDLQAAITAFEESFGAPVTATGEQVTATAEIGEAIRRGMIARRILDGVIRRKYKNNVGKLRAWTSASHIETKSTKGDDTLNA
ncbi:MAG: hypothetical protein WA584_12500 [Pyrinomonadaceae bacterium]